MAHNVLANQKVTLDALTEAGASSVEWSDERGVAAYVRGSFGHMGSAPLPNVLAFLAEFDEVFGPAGFVPGLEHVRTRNDSLGWQHFEFQQRYQIGGQTSADGANLPRPLKVHGGFVVAHVDGSGDLIEIQSSCWRDVLVVPQATIGGEELRAGLRRGFLNAPALGSVLDVDMLQNIDRIVASSRPELVVLPFEGGFRLSFLVRGPIAYRSDGTAPLPQFSRGEIFVDAVSGNRLLERAYAADAESPDSGEGLSQLPFGGPFTTRPLNIVRVDDSDTYRLRDTTHSRDIVTYDLAGAIPDGLYFETGNQLTNGSIEPSTDDDGDKDWDDVAADDSESELSASQQTEVDAHYLTCVAVHDVPRIPACDHSPQRLGQLPWFRERRNQHLVESCVRRSVRRLRGSL